MANALIYLQLEPADVTTESDSHLQTARGNYCYLPYKLDAPAIEWANALAGASSLFHPRLFY